MKTNATKYMERRKLLILVIYTHTHTYTFLFLKLDVNFNLKKTTIHTMDIKKHQTGLGKNILIRWLLYTFNLVMCIESRDQALLLLHYNILKFDILRAFWNHLNLVFSPSFWRNFHVWSSPFPIADHAGVRDRSDQIFVMFCSTISVSSL